MEGLSHDAGHCLGVRACLGDYLVVKVIVLEQRKIVGPSHYTTVMVTTWGGGTAQGCPSLQCHCPIRLGP